jgi:hypothetical protein
MLTPVTRVNALNDENHPAFFFIRSIASFCFLVIALIAASRFDAELRLGCGS